MSLKIFPKKKNTAAEIVCDLSLINKTDLANIKRTLNEFGMVYFRNQNLNSKQYLSFAKKIGKPALYPRLKGLNKKFPEITVVQRKKKTKAQVSVNNFTQTQVTQKNLQHLRCYFLNLFQEKVWLIQNFLRSI
jgi:taurine dioxygenase